jgi:predicted Rossmann fold flavoprotein
MTVIVIGAGASGMVAALTAAEKPGNKVILLERQARVGRKLMATGNGRCNLTNLNAAPERYHGADVGFMSDAMAAFSPADTVSFFKSLGLLTVSEEGGRIYPLSNSANSVADVLRYALEQAGVEIISGQPARAIRRVGGGFAVVTDLDEIAADAVIVAAGSAAGEKLGGVGDGYELLKSLGHSRTALHPSLVQITTENAYPRALKGIKADVQLDLAAVFFPQGAKARYVIGQLGNSHADAGYVIAFIGPGSVICKPQGGEPRLYGGLDIRFIRSFGMLAAGRMGMIIGLL